MARDQFTLPLSCSRCGATGSATWEENSAAGPKGLQGRLIGVDGNFHSETGRTGSGSILIVCNGCDQIQPD
jgi:hypothetical protein